MPQHVELVNVEPQLTAVVRDRVLQTDLPRFVPAACGEVWSFFRGAGLPKPGRNVAVYFDSLITVEAGAEATASFTGNGRVVCSQIPGGLAATTAHFGPYGTLGTAHRAILDWCTANGRRLTGVSWELYGHWQDAWNNDPSRIRTDIFYLVEP
jgi:effector-binding domain-containing protein